ncbi:MAG: LytR/AlgR family response regulator transcription factor [Gemmatimonadota bacterium]
MIRAVVVDDEPIARNGLVRLLSEVADIEVVGEAADGDAAVEILRETAPDLVFLDIQMPGLDGLAVADALAADASPPPIVVFVTAYDEYAVRAFEIDAVDYLLKPFDRDRLDGALERARARLRHVATEALSRQARTVLRVLAGGDPTGTASADDDRGPADDVPDAVATDAAADATDETTGASAPASRPDRLVIRDAGTVVFLRPDEVDRIEAAGNYVRVFAGERRHLVRESLKSMEARLDPRRFVRVSRSAIVNLARVREVRPLSNGTHVVRLRDGATVRASRRYGEKLRRAIAGWER